MKYLCYPWADQITTFHSLIYSWSWMWHCNKPLLHITMIYTYSWYDISRTSAQDFGRTVCRLLHFELHCKHSLLLVWSFPLLGSFLLFSPYFFSSESAQYLTPSAKTVLHSTHALLYILSIRYYTINASVMQETPKKRDYHISRPALHSSILYADHLCKRY